MLKKVNSLFWVLKKVLFKFTFIKKCSKKVSKKLLSQKSTQKRAFTSEFSQKRASKSESLKKVNYFFKLTFCLYKWATPCISQTYNRRCDIIFGLVRLPPGPKGLREPKATFELRVLELLPRTWARPCIPQTYNRRCDIIPFWLGWDNRTACDIRTASPYKLTYNCSVRLSPLSVFKMSP